MPGNDRTFGARNTLLGIFSAHSPWPNWAYTTLLALGRGGHRNGQIQGV
jgi:hypothetical protein